LGPAAAGGSSSCASWLVRSDAGDLAVFKPQNGEAFEPGHAGRAEDIASAALLSHSQYPQRSPVKRGIVYGDTTIKEVAAYLLDHENWARVPLTTETVLWLERRPLELGAGLDADGEAAALRSAVIPGGANHSQRFAPSPAALGSVDDAQATFALVDLADALPPPQGSPDRGTAADLVQTYGSLQMFVENSGSAEDMGSACFDAEEVHRIGVLVRHKTHTPQLAPVLPRVNERFFNNVCLCVCARLLACPPGLQDIRLLNLDRHLGNMLVQRDAAAEGGRYHLIPIDHGFILPSYRDLSDVRLEWSSWRQCRQPFSSETLAYIRALDPIQDAVTLKSLGVRDDAVVAMVFATLLLQQAAAREFTLAEIAAMVQRVHAFDDDGAQPSPTTLEDVIRRVLGDLAIWPLPTDEGEDEAPVPGEACGTSATAATTGATTGAARTPRERLADTSHLDPHLDSPTSPSGLLRRFTIAAAPDIARVLEAAELVIADELDRFRRCNPNTLASSTP